MIGTGEVEALREQAVDMCGAIENVIAKAKQLEGAAAMREFLLSIMYPERTVLEERVVHVRLPGSEGYFGVMAGHMPFFAQLQYGVGEYRRADGVTRKFTVLGGFAEVLPDRTTVLADGAALADEMSPDRARVALRKALEVLSTHLSEGELAEAKLEVERAKARLRALGEQV